MLDQQILLDRIADEELLYRRVPHTAEVVRYTGGIPFVTASAFNDRYEKPSVDRAALRNAPTESQACLSDGVVCLLTADVRAITSVILDHTSSAHQSHYAIDVMPRPIYAGNPEGEPENISHAQVEADPHFQSKSRFRKLKEALALIASKRGWAIQPS